MEEKHVEKRVFLNSVEGTFLRTSSIEKYRILSVERGKAKMTIQIPDSLASGLVRNMLGEPFVPIRGLSLNWSEYEKVEEKEVK